MTKSVQERKDSWIQKSNKNHNSKYNYDYVNYVNNTKLVKIICPIHGPFLQSPANHMKGHGCDKCAKEKVSKLLISNTNEFISKAKTVHGDNYIYDNVIYDGNKSKVEIICPIHGSWLITPANHLSGYGCNKCGGSFPSNTEDFIKRCINVHGDKYDYSKVCYKNNKTPIFIICKLHGEFKQWPVSHVRGGDCLKCSNNSSKKEQAWLDSLSIPLEKRNVQLKINGKNFKPDAFDPDSNTIYEFYGDFWHGNPKRFCSDHINHMNGKKFGDLYKQTLLRENYLKACGFKVITCWESDFK